MYYSIQILDADDGIVAEFTMWKLDCSTFKWGKIGKPDFQRVYIRWQCKNKLYSIFVFNNSHIDPCYLENSFTKINTKWVQKLTHPTLEKEEKNVWYIVRHDMTCPPWYDLASFGRKNRNNHFESDAVKHPIIIHIGLKY